MFEKGGVPMFDIHRPNVCEIPEELTLLGGRVSLMTDPDLMKFQTPYNNYNERRVT